MENHNGNNEKSGFSYTYSAKEQREVQKIREKYTAPTEEEDKMERLRRLDASVTKTAQAVALIVGIFGALILGVGMSLVMSDFGAVLGLSEAVSLPLGVGIGLAGFVPIGLAYPIYQAIVKHKRKKLAPEILRLTDELMK